MKSFKVNRLYTVVCHSENTRYGFRHLAELQRNYPHWEILAHAKACYYNRTWESYDFQSVIHDVLSKAFNKVTAKRYRKKIDAEALGHVNDHFNLVAGIAKLGEILCEKPEDQNAWKKRMIATVPGIDFPEEFNALSEEEKEKRLNGVIGVLAEKSPSASSGTTSSPTGGAS